MVAVQHENGVRTRIVNAARTLFTTRGFHQTAMAELAAEANVSVGAIYRLFKGKAEIITAIVCDDSDARLAEIVRFCDDVKAGTITPEHALRQIALYQLSDKDEGLSFEILAEAHRNAEVAATIGGMCGSYRAVFRDLACVVNPRLTDLELDAAEELMLACMFGLGHRNLSGPRLGVEATADLTARMIVAALAAV